MMQLYQKPLTADASTIQWSKVKGQTMIYKTLQRKLGRAQRTPSKPVVNTYASEVLDVA
jgi:hypothetical protein